MRPEKIAEVKIILGIALFLALFIAGFVITIFRLDRGTDKYKFDHLNK